MFYKIKSYLENHRDLNREGGGSFYGFHDAIIVLLCVLLLCEGIIGFIESYRQQIRAVYGNEPFISI